MKVIVAWNDSIRQYVYWAGKHILPNWTLAIEEAEQFADETACQIRIGELYEKGYRSHQMAEYA